MAVTIADLRARVETDLDDPTLQRIMDAAVKSIDRAAGKADEQVETRIATNSEWIATSRRMASVTSIEERRRVRSDPINLSANDYRIVGATRLLRESGGDNGASFWGAQVTITYVPEVDQDVRDRVTLDLSAVDLEFRAYEQERSGDWSGKADWKKQRSQLLRQVREGRSPIV